MIHLLYNQEFSDIGITLVEGPHDADFDALWKEFDEARRPKGRIIDHYLPPFPPAVLDEKVVKLHEQYDPKTPADMTGLENRMIRFFANWLCANKKGFTLVPHGVTEI